MHGSAAESPAITGLLGVGANIMLKKVESFTVDYSVFYIGFGCVMTLLPFIA